MEKICVCDCLASLNFFKTLWMSGIFKNGCVRVFFEFSSDLDV